MITHNGKYLGAATHHGMPIYAATMGGKMVIGWLQSATLQAIVAAFGAEGTEVIRKTNDYLNRIATTDPQRALQISEFINEDPLLVCSLVETSKTRWLVGDGKACIDTGVDYSTMKSSVHFFVKFMLNTSLTGENDFWGKGEGGTPTIGFQGTTYFSWATSGSSWNPTTTPATLNTPHTYGIKFMLNKGREADIDGVHYSTTTHNNQFGGSANTIHFFASTVGRYPIKAMASNGRLTIDEEVVRDFIPMQRTDGTCGMLDIISGTFYPNANTSGSFTITITDK
jgi:hypothetical protein